MSIEFEETINHRRLSEGESLQDVLNGFDTEEKKNAIIGYRCINKDIPIENDDLQWIDFKSAIDTLAFMGICYIDEDDMEELLEDFKDEVGELYENHRAWSVLTVLEVDDFENPAYSYYEANIYLNGTKINGAAIDLLCESQEIDLITCKFNIATQVDDAKKRAEELREVSDDVDGNCSVCLGTLNPKVKERIQNQVGDSFDRIISGIDILEFQ